MNSVTFPDMAGLTFEIGVTGHSVPVGFKRFASLDGGDSPFGDGGFGELAELIDEFFRIVFHIFENIGHRIAFHFPGETDRPFSTSTLTA